MTHLGPYELLSQLGSGGMAQVFKARRRYGQDVAQVVALKRILPPFQGHQEFARMFATEARLQASLSHPKLIGFRDLSCHDGEWLLALEYFPSRNLHSLLQVFREQQVALPWQAAVFIASEVLDVLHYLHHTQLEERRSGIVHRDINPHNVLVSQGGWIKVADLGIAKDLNQSSASAQQALKGKIPYLSPEQIQGLPATPLSDMFSWGLLAYELFFQRHPFLKASDAATLQAILHEPAALPPASSVAKEIVALIQACLEKDPARRPQDAGALRHALLARQDMLWLTDAPSLLSALLAQSIPTDAYLVEAPLHHTAVDVGGTTEPHPSIAHPPPSKTHPSDAPAAPSPPSLWQRGSVRFMLATLASLSLAAVFWGTLQGSRVEPRDRLEITQEPPVVPRDIHGAPVDPAPSVSAQVSVSPLPQPDLRPKTPPQALPTRAIPQTSQPLARAPSPNRPAVRGTQTATLTLSGPVGTRIYINGRHVGSLPLNPLKLASGDYLVLMKHLDGRTFVKKLQLSAGQTQNLPWGQY